MFRLPTRRVPVTPSTTASLSAVEPSAWSAAIAAFTASGPALVRPSPAASSAKGIMPALTSAGRAIKVLIGYGSWPARLPELRHRSTGVSTSMVVRPPERPPHRDGRGRGEPASPPRVVFTLSGPIDCPYVRPSADRTKVTTPGSDVISWMRPCELGPCRRCAQQDACSRRRRRGGVLPHRRWSLSSTPGRRRTPTCST